MASTYTTRGKLEKQGDGENDTTWGSKANTVFDLIDEWIAGYISISVAGNSNVTLTQTSGVSDQVRQHVIEFTGVLTGNINVIVPTAEGWWCFYNNTSGSFTLTVKTSGGTGIAITQGHYTLLFCDGTNVVQPTPFEMARFRAGDGAVGTPSLSFAADTNNGFYRIGTDNWGASVAGVLAHEWKSDGAYLTPLQPMVLARISSEVTDGTGDGTVVTLNWATEIFDRGGDLSGTTFTAPQTGIYRVSASARLAQLGAAHTRATLVVVASSRSPIIADISPIGAANITDYMLSGTTLIDMTAGQTFTITCTVSGSTKTVDIQADAQYLGLSVELIG